MRVISILQNVIAERLLLYPDADGTLVLREEQGNMEMCVEVVDAFGCVVAIHLNCMGHLGGLKDGPWKRIADYLVVSVRGGKCCVSFVELKRTLTNNNRGTARDQLLRSTPILGYLHSLCELQFGFTCDVADMAVNYFILANRDKTQLRKDHVKKRPREVLLSEAYQDITISSFRGKSIPFAVMVPADLD